MKACIGDYVKVREYDNFYQVVGIRYNGRIEVYETTSGRYVYEDELDIDDILLGFEYAGLMGEA